MEADIRSIAAVAAALRARRMERGALEADSGEPVVRFEGDRVAEMHLEGRPPRTRWWRSA